MSIYVTVKSFQLKLACNIQRKTLKHAVQKTLKFKKTCFNMIKIINNQKLNFYHLAV